jgi:hypothetical protein
MVTVEVIQAHRIATPEGGYIRRGVGDRLTIARRDVCPNLHRLVKKEE